MLPSSVVSGFMGPIPRILDSHSCLVLNVNCLLFIKHYEVVKSEVLILTEGSRIIWRMFSYWNKKKKTSQCENDTVVTLYIKQRCAESHMITIRSEAELTLNQLK